MKIRSKKEILERNKLLSEFSVLDAIELESITNIYYPNSEYFYRNICRQYSTKFHTPLHVVETLPTDYVLRHYYEDKYANLKNNSEESEDDLRLYATDRFFPEMAEENEKEIEEFAENTETNYSSFLKKKQSLNKKLPKPSLKSNESISNPNPEKLQKEDKVINFNEKDFLDEQDL